MSQLTDNLYSIDAIKSDIKSAIEAKGVDMTGVSFPGYATAIGNIPQSMTGYTEKEITEGTFDIVTLNNSASYVSYYAFENYQSIQTVSLSMCENVYTSAFAGCNNLSFVSIPLCTSIRQNAFKYCRSLSYIYCPEVVSMEPNVFSDCQSLLSIDLPKLTTIPEYAFYNCYSLSQINITSCTNIKNNAFEKCSNLLSVNIPNCDFINAAAFQNCKSLSSISVKSTCTVYRSAFQGCGFVHLSTDLSSFLSQHTFRSNYKLLTAYLPEVVSTVEGFLANCSSLYSVSIPKCTFISMYTFNACYALSFISLNNVSRIGKGAFVYCSSLDKLVIAASSVCTLDEGQEMFKDTNNKFKVYVPSSLVDSYKTAQYWSSISARIFPIIGDFEYSNGLVYGWASSMDSTYLTTLGITVADVTGVSMEMLTDLASSTFMNHINLTSVSLPVLGEYKDDTFNGCSALTSFTVNVSALGDRVFANCTSLETVDLNYDNVITAGSSIFDGCTALTSIYVAPYLYDNYIIASGWSEYSNLFVQKMPELSYSDGIVYGSISSVDTNLYTSLGINSSSVVSIYLPNCQYVGISTFRGCSNLTTVDLPNCVNIETSAFAECTHLQTLNIPNCEYIGANALQGACQKNTTGSYMTLDLNACSYIGNQAFYWTQRSWTITLGYSEVVTLGGTWVFSATTVQSLYVPASLVDSYKVAYGWSQYSSIIFPISE